MYNSLVEKCFKECVESFRRKDLDGGEERVCVLSSSCCFGVQRVMYVGRAVCSKLLLQVYEGISTSGPEIWGAFSRG